jgi:FAD binding domain/Phage integrase family
VIDEFIDRYAKPKNRGWQETVRLLSEFSKPWVGRGLASIDNADIHRVLDAIVARGAPIAANRAFAQLRKLCNWAVSRGIIKSNPCDGISPPSEETARDRVLSLDELHLVWNATDRLGFPFGPITKLLILTGQRRSEVGDMEWNEIDVEKCIWTIPAVRSKNKCQHVVPLSPQATEIIHSLPRFAGSKFLWTRIVEALHNILPGDRVIDHETGRRPYESDGLTAYRNLPLVVVLPENVRELRAVLSYCYENSLKVVPRRAGASLSGGALPLEDGVLISMMKFNKIKEIDFDNRIAVVEPGVTNLAITRAVEHRGFYYAPDPSSQIACSNPA